MKFTLLMDALRQASTHEEAARRMLDELFTVARNDLIDVARNEDLERAEVVRTVLHLRPELGYRALIAVGSDDRMDDVALSTTAWNLVRQTRAAVAVDVEIGRYRYANGETVDLELPATGLGRDTFRRMKRRRATHFVGLPLRLPGDQFMGMVTIEVSCPDAAGGDFGLWASCGADLQTIVDLGALVLDRLPLEVRSDDPGPLPAVSPRMASVLDLLRAFAPAPSTLLLLGESGTGKTRLARWCHDISPRSASPFVVAALHQVPEPQAQARLFGVAPGGYTDAVERDGHVQQAEGGTLFIDEVSELTPTLQLSLLRLLDEGCYQRMGESEDRQADIRIIASTNVNLAEAVRQGRFRQDLRYRLEMLAVEIPPLRERVEEIPGWSERFLAEVHERSHRDGAALLTADAARLVQQIPHEANLRGVRSLIERAHAFCARGGAGDVRIGPEDIQRAQLSSAGPGAASRVFELLRGAAEAFLVARENAADADRLFDEAKGLFAAMLLRVTLQQSGGAKEAARRLGFGHRIRGGNHLETFRQYAPKLEALGERLGVSESLWRSEIE